MNFFPIELVLLVVVSLTKCTFCHCFVSQRSDLIRSNLYSNLHQRRRRSSTLILAAPDGLEWFIKTETFAKPYPEVKSHLEEHREWVRSLRAQMSGEKQIVSGYRVDAHDRPGGGGLLIFAAKDFAEADEFIRNNDPLILNDCVEWQLNKWIPETGDIKL